MPEIDVSLELPSVCVVDGQGKIMKAVGPSPSICSLYRIPRRALATIDASVALRTCSGSRRVVAVQFDQVEGVLALRAARPIQFPTNIELVQKYYDKIDVTTIAAHDDR
jgi:hypothetical protein